MSKPEIKHEDTIAQGVRWPKSLRRLILAWARKDGVAFSPEVVGLVRLGIERRNETGGTP